MNLAHGLADDCRTFTPTFQLGLEVRFLGAGENNQILVGIADTHDEIAFGLLEWAEVESGLLVSFSFRLQWKNSNS
jgi:hypothetical protein